QKFPRVSFDKALAMANDPSIAKGSVFRIHGPINPADLQKLVPLSVEVGLLRLKQSNEWLMVKGDADENDVREAGPLNLFDIYIHNHPEENLEALPSPGDLYHFTNKTGFTNMLLVIVTGHGMGRVDTSHFAVDGAQAGGPVTQEQIAKIIRADESALK